MANLFGWSSRPRERRVVTQSSRTDPIMGTIVTTEYDDGYVEHERIARYPDPTFRIEDEISEPHDLNDAYSRVAASMEVERIRAREDLLRRRQEEARVSTVSRYDRYEYRNWDHADINPSWQQQREQQRLQEPATLAVTDTLRRTIEEQQKTINQLIERVTLLSDKVTSQHEDLRSLERLLDDFVNKPD